MESKHRYRGAAGKACPSCGSMSVKTSKKEFGGGFYCDAKSGGCNARFKPGSAEARQLDALPNVRAENQDPADQYNTVLKMAKKRALVDAVLTATAASDIFAQDLEDLEDKIEDADVAATVAEAKRPTVTESTATSVPDKIEPTASQPAKKPAKNGNAAPVHPSMKVGKDLFNLLPSDRRSEIMGRLCRLFGVASAKELNATNLEPFGAAAQELIDAHNDGGIEAVDGLLSGFENTQPASSSEGSQA